MPAGNINLDYSEIVRVSGVMNQAVNDINPHLLSTKTSVEGCSTTACSCSRAARP
ncbi:hypothetical protein [Streptomyces sp. SCUT-3]|uniref:hypothetical protein n=1 Tax=Streptomyces sp. SCUT-3 TaxID=2684469 RepID=UPI002174EDFF|nr:hypothetical protein [Streptomyces sp. SCUT-3]